MAAKFYMDLLFLFTWMGNQSFNLSLFHTIRDIYTSVTKQDNKVADNNH